MPEQPPVVQSSFVWHSASFIGVSLFPGRVVGFSWIVHAVMRTRISIESNIFFIFLFCSLCILVSRSIKTN